MWARYTLPAPCRGAVIPRSVPHLRQAAQHPGPRRVVRLAVAAVGGSSGSGEGPPPSTIKLSIESVISPGPCQALWSWVPFLEQNQLETQIRREMVDFKIRQRVQGAMKEDASLKKIWLEHMTDIPPISTEAQGPWRALWSWSPTLLQVHDWWQAEREWKRRDAIIRAGLVKAIAARHGKDADRIQRQLKHKCEEEARQRQRSSTNAARSSPAKGTPPKAPPTSGPWPPVSQPSAPAAAEARAAAAEAYAAAAVDWASAAVGHEAAAEAAAQRAQLAVQKASAAAEWARAGAAWRAAFDALETAVQADPDAAAVQAAAAAVQAARAVNSQQRGLQS